MVNAQVLFQAHSLHGRAPPLGMRLPARPGVELLKTSPVLQESEVVDPDREALATRAGRPTRPWLRRASAAMADRNRRASSQAERLLTWIPIRTRQSSPIDSGKRAITRFMIKPLLEAAAA